MSDHTITVDDGPDHGGVDLQIDGPPTMDRPLTNYGYLWGPEDLTLAEIVALLRARLAAPSVPEGMTAERLREIADILPKRGEAHADVCRWAAALDEGTDR